MSPVREVLPDGTRVYTNGVRYKPVPASERVNGVNRPADPRAVRFHTRWFLPLNVLPDDERLMPLTRPDDATLRHRASCTCEVCQRPQARILWRRARRSARR
jgi:hypothetical protein